MLAPLGVFPLVSNIVSEPNLAVLESPSEIHQPEQIISAQTEKTANTTERETIGKTKQAPYVVRDGRKFSHSHAMSVRQDIRPQDDDSGVLYLRARNGPADRSVHMVRPLTKHKMPGKTLLSLYLPCSMVYIAFLT